MNSLIVTQAARLIAPLLLFLSIAALWRGHHLPGGGFIGGLLAASGVLLFAKGYGWGGARRKLRVEPLHLMGIGILIATFSGWLGVLAGKSFMSGLWLDTFYMPLLGDVHLGTPLLFDLGVYLTVVGFVIKAAFAFGEEN